MLNRIAKCGYKITMLGKNVRVNRGVESHSGRIRSVYNDIFNNNSTTLIKRLERDIEIKNEYIKGLEELLYKKFISEP